MFGRATGEVDADASGDGGEGGEEAVEVVRAEEIHAAGAGAAFLDGAKGALVIFAEHPTGLGGSSVDSEDKLFGHRAHVRHCITEIENGLLIFPDWYRVGGFSWLAGDALCAVVDAGEGVSKRGDPVC